MVAVEDEVWTDDDDDASYVFAERGQEAQDESATQRSEEPVSRTTSKF